jgi:uncharacterized protein
MLEKIIKWLQQPSTYKTKDIEIKTIHTHISVVILVGDFAFKIKKPVNFGFVNFTSLSQRKKFCYDEIRLNSILAKQIYLEVIPIYYNANTENFSFEIQGKIVEYVIKMCRFSQNNLFSTLLVQNKISQKQIADLSLKIANFHQNQKESNKEFGTFENITSPMLDNFKQIQEIITTDKQIQQLTEIKKETKKQLELLQNTIAKRTSNKKIKECHGDMHSNNICLFKNKIMIFDCIEFNEYFRNIDVMNDFAFLYMDLQTKNKNDLSAMLLNSYINTTQDWEGLRLLRLYCCYRAMVRAKIAQLTLKDLSSAMRKQKQQEYERYINYAYLLFKKQKKNKIIIMNGLSGSGKSSVSNILMQKGEFIRLQTDYYRKVILKNCKKEEIYSQTNIKSVYFHLLFLCKMCIKAGFDVIVDGAFLQKKERSLFLKQAENLQVDFVILSTQCSYEMSAQRIQKRLLDKNNISDATCDVLNMQYENKQDFDVQEQKFLHIVNTENYDESKIAKDLERLL